MDRFVPLLYYLAIVGTLIGYRVLVRHGSSCSMRPGDSVTHLPLFRALNPHVVEDALGHVQTRQRVIRRQHVS